MKRLYNITDEQLEKCKTCKWWGSDGGKICGKQVGSEFNSGACASRNNVSWESK